MRQLELHNPDEKKAIKQLGLITAKKVLYVANVDETDLQGESAFVKSVRERGFDALIPQG